MNLSLDEIEDHKKFEDLMVSYFEDLKNEGAKNIVDVSVKPSGTGADGGRDIFVTIRVNDGIVSFERRWIVQCKFHSSDIAPDKISDINLPSLLSSYGASGYLLVCKQKPTSKLTKMFEDLEKESHNGQQFVTWSGEQLKRQILIKSKKEILQQYFPNYFKYFLTINL